MQVTEPKAKGSSVTPAKDADVAKEIMAALDAKDSTKASAMIQEGLTRKTLSSSASKLLGKLTELDQGEGIKATIVAVNCLSQGSLPSTVVKQIKDTSRTLIYSLAEKHGLVEVEKYHNSLDSEQQEHQKRALNHATKLANLLHNEPAYLELVKSDPEGKNAENWGVGLQSIKQASLGLSDHLETLAGEGNVAAMGLLCRRALAMEDTQMLERMWGRVPDKTVNFTVAFERPKEANLEFVSKTMTEEEKKDLYTNMLASSDRFSLSELVRATETALKNSYVKLENLETKTLTSISKSKAFGAQALEILKSRPSSP